MCRPGCPQTGSGEVQEAEGLTCHNLLCHVEMNSHACQLLRDPGYTGLCRPLPAPARRARRTHLLITCKKRHDRGTCPSSTRYLVHPASRWPALTCPLPRLGKRARVGRNCSGLPSQITMSLLRSKLRISSTFLDTSRRASRSLRPAYLAAQEASSARSWIRDSLSGAVCR